MSSSSSSRLASITAANVVTAVATVLFLRSTWRNTPDWMKPVYLRKRIAEEKDANDDLASPAAIISKLQEMLKIVGCECDEVTPDDLPWYKIYACFLTLVHMSEEIRRNHPDYRDGWFEKGGRKLQDDELKELPELLDFADWAYDDDYFLVRDNLAKRSYVLLRQDRATEPGRVGHYIAVNFERKTVLITLKGTSTFGDLLTDLLGKAVEHTFDAPFDDKYGMKPIRCHEGIWTAAKMMADDTQELIEHLFLPGGFKLIIVGHSLGAGTACLLGMILRSRLPALRKKESLRVMAFASPPVLNYDAAAACAPFTTTVVNDTDVIPRASLGNVVIMNKLLMKVDEKLKEEGLSPGNMKSARALFSDLMKYDEKTLMSTEEMDQFFAETHTKEDLNDEDNLYVPGKVISIFEKGVKVEGGEETQYGAVVADGGLAGLRQIEVRMEMITDHFCKNYRVAVEGLCRQTLG